MSRLRMIGFCLCALVVVALLTLAYRAMPERKPSPRPAPLEVAASAKLIGAVQPRWAAGSTPPAVGQPIPLDRRLELERGAIEITHGKGTRMLLEGPSAFRYMPGGRLELKSGQATIVTGDEPELLVEIEGTTIEPTAGTIGIRVTTESVEIHSLDGQARIVQVRSQEGLPVEIETALETGGALRWLIDATGPPKSVSATPARFLIALPDRVPDRSVARLRAAAANHSRLIHQYTFEGTSRQEKCRDQRGALHLAEAVMVSGRGRGSLDYTAQGLDLTTEAIGPHREPVGGNENGVALQSEARWHPPKAMTIELLLRYRIPEDADDETIALAVATRDGDRDCSFYVAAVGRGHLSMLLDKEADWVAMDTVLASDHWYYVAVTFDAGETKATVNAYCADLTGGQRTLKRVLENEEVQGVPAMSRLGIGKGFDSTGAHAYPWSGELDEVAVYDDILAFEELQSHVNVLRANGPSSQ